MPLSSGMIAVFGPTAGANDLIASSRSKALQLSSTTSNFSLSLSACTVGGFFSVTSPAGLLITRPALASSACAFRPHQEGDVLAGLQQPAAEIAADRAGADHENAHAIFPVFVVEKRAGN